MTSKTAQYPELSHGSMSKCSVLKHALDLLDSHRVVNVFVPASLDNYRRRSISNYES